MNLVSLLEPDSDPRQGNSGHNREVDSFQYRPLDHRKHSIRVIRILPDLSSDGIIRCEIWHTTVRSQYQCLSYRWGDLTDSKTVLIRDTQSTDLEERPCQIRQNLYSFLNAVRGHAVLADTFWIDALCIDQENGQERNHQVTQMGRIYIQASRVVVWLGHFSRVVRYGERDYEEFCKEVDRNEYWQRAWIAQEFVLPRHIDFLINDTLVTYSDIRVSSSSQPRMRTLVTSRNRYEKLRESFWHRFWLGKTSLSDDFFLLEARDVECSIPRDRIFSLLSLLKEGKHITVDYQMPAPELAYHLLKLFEKPLYLSTIGQLLSLIKDEGFVSSEAIGVAGPYVELRTFFTGTQSRATEWQSDQELCLVDKLLGGKGLGSDTVMYGKGFVITRKDTQSLLLNVRVALSVLLDYFDPWSWPYYPIVEDPRFDAEFEAWTRTCFPHYLYYRIFRKTLERTWIAWSEVKVGYELTPNQRSVPFNLILMGLVTAPVCCLAQ